MPFLQPGKLQLALNCFQPYGWGFNNGGSDASVLPDSRLAAIKAAGFDVLRMVIDPSKLCSAADDAALAALIAQLKVGIDRRFKAGLKVLADIHFMPSSPSAAGWSRWDVIDGVSGPKFQRMVYCVTKLAQMLATYDPSVVALELFNEPPSVSDFGGKQPWGVQLKAYFDSIRAVIPQHTIIVEGTNWAALDGFTSGNGADGLINLVPANFDANTAYAWHPYEPVAVSMQGEGGEYQNCHRLTFPPANHPGGQTKALAELDAAIDADTGLNASQKAQRKSEFRQQGWSFSYPTYFGTPQDAAWIAKRYAIAANWADKNHIPRSQLAVTEVGVKGDLGSNLGADDATTTAFLAAHKAAALSAGIGLLTVHEMQNGDGFGVMLGNVFRPAVVAGLGLGTTPIPPIPIPPTPTPTVTSISTTYGLSDGTSKTVKVL